MKRFQVFSFAVFALLTLWLSACSSTTDAPPVETYTPPTYPTKTAVKWYYQDYVDSANTGTFVKLPNERREEIAGTQVYQSRNAYKIVGTDTIPNFSGVVRDTSYIVIENKSDLATYIASPLDFFGGISGITISNSSLSNTWLTSLQYSRGLNTSYTVIDSATFTVTADVLGTPVSLPASLKMRGTVNGKESITVPAGTFNTVKLTLQIDATIGSGATALPIPVTLTYWAADSVGIVKSDLKGITTDFIGQPVIVPSTRRELLRITGN